MQSKPSKKYYALKKIRLGKGQNQDSINEFHVMSFFKCSNLMSIE